MVLVLVLAGREMQSDYDKITEMISTGGEHGKLSDQRIAGKDISLLNLLIGTFNFEVTFLTHTVLVVQQSHMLLAAGFSGHVVVVGAQIRA